MKNKKAVWTLAVVVLLAAAVAFAFFSTDSIGDTTVKTVDRTSIIRHTFKSGETLDASVSYNHKKLSDRVHYLHILISSQDEHSDYKPANINAALQFDSGAEIVSAFFSDGNGKYYSAQTQFTNETEVICSGKSDYLAIEIVYICDSDEVPDIHIKYDIIGESFRFLNRFVDQEQVVKGIQ